MPCTLVVRVVNKDYTSAQLPNLSRAELAAINRKKTKPGHVIEVLNFGESPSNDPAVIRKAGWKVIDIPDMTMAEGRLLRLGPSIKQEDPRWHRRDMKLDFSMLLLARRTELETNRSQRISASKTEVRGMRVLDGG